MKKQKINKGIIVLNKGERIAVISLLCIISILMSISVFRPSLSLSRKERTAFHNLDSMIAIQEKALAEQQAKAEQIQAEQAKENHSTSTPIGKTMSKGKPTSNTATDTKAASKPLYKEGKAIPILDINTADSITLVALPQIGETMASRIHRYRNRLGGFVCFEQLFEIRGMDSARFNTIKPYIVLENNEIAKINVNRDEFKTLLRHPYLEYDQVKAIVNHRERKGMIKDWEQLKAITGEVNPLLEHYVEYD